RLVHPGELNRDIDRHGWRECRKCRSVFRPCRSWSWMPRFPGQGSDMLPSPQKKSENLGEASHPWGSNGGSITRGSGGVDPVSAFPDGIWMGHEVRVLRWQKPPRTSGAHRGREVGR